MDFIPFSGIRKVFEEVNAIRISYANSYENLKKAVINIRKALEKLT